MDVTLHCPKCQGSLVVPISEISPGKSIVCPSCATTISFAGQDAAKVQAAIDQLTNQLGSGAVKVTVNMKQPANQPTNQPAKQHHPWWKFA